jgi:hypothetical protein
VDGDLAVDVPAMKARLKAKEVERAKLVERLRRLGGDNIVQLPNAYDAYRANGRDLGKRLLDEIDRPSEALHNYIDHLVIQPSASGDYVVDAYAKVNPDGPIAISKGTPYWCCAVAAISLEPPGSWPPKSLEGTPMIIRPRP